MEAIYGKVDDTSAVATKTTDSDENATTMCLSKETLMEPNSYLCEVCLQPPFSPDPAVIDTLRSVAIKKQFSKALDFEHAEEGGSKKVMMGGAQLLASATDRARQLGLISGGVNGGGSRASVASVDLADRQTNETTDVNLRIPSPPRASKRKQDLTTASCKRFPLMLRYCFILMQFSIFHIIFKTDLKIAYWYFARISVLLILNCVRYTTVIPYFNTNVT